MRILVLGATGYVGSRLVPALVEAGHDVVAASSSPPDPDRFAWGGEVKPMPDPASLDDHTWGDWLFLENNEAGVVREWWCHVPTSFWFIAERNTVTDEILKTYPAGELFKERVNFAARAEKK